MPNSIEKIVIVFYLNWCKILSISNICMCKNLDFRFIIQCLYVKLKLKNLGVFECLIRKM